MLRLPRPPFCLLPTALAVLAVGLNIAVQFKLRTTFNQYTAIRLFISYWQLNGSDPRLSRTFVDVELDGNQETNCIKLAFSAVRIHEIITRNDAAHGVHFHFGDSSTYGNFIAVQNLMLRAYAKRYIVDGADHWYFHQPPESSPE